MKTFNPAQLSTTQIAKYLAGLLVLAVLSGCPVTSQKPAFDLDHSVAIAGLDGRYTLVDMTDDVLSDSTHDNFRITESNNRTLITNTDCIDRGENADDCSGVLTVIKSPGFENTYFVQIEDDPGESFFYVYVYPWEDYWVTCRGMSDWRQYSDKVEFSAALHDFRIEPIGRHFLEVTINEPEPGKMTGFLDAIRAERSREYLSLSWWNNEYKV